MADIEQSAPEEQTPAKEPGFFSSSNRLELVATIIMALAAIFTAWAAFQSAKWSGEQSTFFSKAGAARTESTRFDTRAGQDTGIDVAVFVGWLDALNSDIAAGLVDLGPGVVYEPTDGTLSGFLFERVRPEFRPAFDAWLVEFAADRDAASATPFSMEEYVLANSVEALSLQAEADDLSVQAAKANQNSDNYVLTAVAFALVLFFGGVSSKLGSKRNSYLAIGVAAVMFVGATIVLVVLPKIGLF